MTKKVCYVFDIDGTISDCEHRIHHVRGEKKDWIAFYGAQLKDPPIPHMVRLAQQLAEVTPVLFVTGRPGDYRRATQEWLRLHVGDSFDGLYMRAPGDFRDDGVVKLELIGKARADGYEVIMAFEDRDRVVRAYRAAGIPTMQCCPGDF